LRALHEFFAALPFWRMQPLAEVTGSAEALAEPGKVYVAYFPHGGSAELDLKKAPGRLVTRWYNPRSGKFGKETDREGGGQARFDAPDGNDWALLVEVARDNH
jgi:hypothetical protein